LIWIDAVGGAGLGALAGAVYAYLNDGRRFRREIRGAFAELDAMGLFDQEQARGEDAAEAPADPSAEHILRVGAGR
jgi:hypothetical protein